MKKPKTLRQVDRYRDLFVEMRDADDLADLLQVSTYKLKLIGAQPAYRIFHIPKLNGKKRLIEDPPPRLKRIQKQLNAFLQAVYFFLKTEAAYGFVMNARGDGETRDIITNAEQHLGCQYLYNADIQDFFHQVKSDRLRQLFYAPPFDFEEDLTELLVSLMTHNGRLPMGAPTSPVLSNFATIEMDNDLLQLAQWDDWSYTRYADDMSFSAQSPFDTKERSMIETAVQEHGYTFNATKFKYFRPLEEKMVTGLVLGDGKVELPRDFMPNLREEIERLQHVMETAPLSGRSDREWIDEYEDRLEGLLGFATRILGNDNKEVVDCEEALNRALHPPNDAGMLSWLDFPYF